MIGHRVVADSGMMFLVVPLSRLAMVMTAETFGEQDGGATRCCPDPPDMSPCKGTRGVDGTVCEQDVVPFAGSAAAALTRAAASRQAASRFLRGRLLPQVVIRSLD